ncbi:DUF86 domain-containing protein [Anaerovibrio lipolyticus]|uniref:HepT-like ribonuclease domain-containing protein n=1 Tax=Anaerovibrio lipolyticus TaxID=82374 RepID=UPI00068FF76C|nr:HepT-like ribonuclease domain-containing protein [Anaerovibrio lipolyticus]
MDNPTKDEQILQHIVRYCNQIQTTVKELKIDEKNLETNFIYQNALSLPIIQIGELVKKLSDKFREDNSFVPWRNIAGMRDKLTHDYANLDTAIVWDVVSNKIDELNKNCTKILKDKNIPVPKPETVNKGFSR